METKRLFLIISDLDGTFDTKNSQDIYNFVDNCKKISNEFKVKVKVHFVSGTTVNDLEKTICEYTNMCPELAPFLGQHIIENGVLTNSLGKFKKRICKNTDFYDKSYGVEYVLQQTLDFGESILGCCYVGDSAIDIPAFEYLELIDKYYPLNATPIILNRNASSAMNKNIVIQRENCLGGVNKGLDQMITLIKFSKAAQENKAKEESSTKTPKF